MTELTLPLSIIAITFLFVGGLVFFRRGIKMRKPKKNEFVDTYKKLHPELVNIHFGGYKFWLSIIKVEHTLFSRRNGYSGRRIFGYSVVLRLFGKEMFSEYKPTKKK